MRFSRWTSIGVAMAGAFVLAPWSVASQEAVPEPAAEAAPEPEAAPRPPAEACPQELGDSFLDDLGQPGAWLDAEQAVYSPPGVTALGHPASYLIVTGPGENEAAKSPVRRLAYRLEGVNTRWGAEYAPDVRTAFDRLFDTKACGDGGGSCMVDFRGAVAGQRSGAELSNRAPSVPRGASGGVTRLVKADYDLDGADPVYLICHYATE